MSAVFSSQRINGNPVFSGQNISAPAPTPSDSPIIRVSASTADTIILLQNLSRGMVIIFNESTAVMYLCLSKQVSSNVNYSVQVLPNQSYIVESGYYCGEIHAIWASANGAAMITELI